MYKKNTLEKLENYERAEHFVTYMHEVMYRTENQLILILHINHYVCKEKKNII